jgi:hypothetical protein
MPELTVQVRDEMGDGEWLGELKVPLEEAPATVREFIRARVEFETNQHNAELDRGRSFRGLVGPPPAVTSELNGWAGRKRVGQAVDGAVMLEIAFEAYDAGELLLLVDDEMTGTLDSEITIVDGCTTLFRKLKPLVVPQTNPGRIRSKHEKMPKHRR